MGGVGRRSSPSVIDAFFAGESFASAGSTM